MTHAHQLYNQYGQSVWLDYIRRQFITNGGLQEIIDNGVRGVTSNPSIFEKAISGSSDYDAAMKPLAEADRSADDIYEALAIADIQMAADLLRPIYDDSDGIDGFVSLEVSPKLANDTEGTIEEARRLNAAVGRPNVMIKVPATPAGIPAIETLIGDGININVTLIFAISAYEQVMNAYISGLEKYAEAGGDISKVASVASFFVSRVDAKIDKQLEALGNTDLQGKIAIANAKLAYARFKEIFGDDRWRTLANQGARVQRPLWASTSTKNPSYPDTLYVDELVGMDTVNTMPMDTLDAFLDHGTLAATLAQDVEAAREQIKQLSEVGIDLDQATQDLLDEGIEKFVQPFESLMASIEEKRDLLQAGKERVEFHLGAYQDRFEAATRALRDNEIMKRIWQQDHTVWSDSPKEISNRLGWLTIAEKMASEMARFNALVDVVRKDGYTNVLLLGMGGSSLAPEVFARTFGVADGYLQLDVLDSTDPDAVLAYADKLDVSKTLFIVATKSGGTAETLSFFKFFYNRTLDAVGADSVGQHFIAITDPDSKLETLAQRLGFRATFLNDPNIGGRYSALSYFGLVPAALIGVDLATLLERAQKMAINCDYNNCPSEGDNNGGRIGVLLGELAKAGRNKATFVISPQIAAFGDWAEQLIAESTGKDSKGILPVVNEPIGSPDVYGADRVFIYLRFTGDTTHDDAIEQLKSAGHPIVTLHVDDLYDIGGQYFLWEMATAVAGHSLSIHPFDQPNVEAAKVLARQMIEAYQQTGKLPELQPTLQADGVTVYGDVHAATPGDALADFIANPQDGAYVTLQAYIQPTSEADEALEQLRTALRDRTKLATTSAYGPRFLHSTGQLHKGDAGRGLFIQFMDATQQDADIPDEAGETRSSMSFGTLKLAQALGDRQALLDAGRQVIRFDLGNDAATTLKALAYALA